MAKFSEMGFGARFVAVLVTTLLAGAAYYYAYLNNEIQKNQQLVSKIADKKAENDRLREFEPKLKQLEREMAILEQQIEREKKVVPEDKDADQLIRLLHDTAASAGIEIRRYTAQPTASHEFYSEVPFVIDIDGPYYSVLNFFQRVSELERIVNIDNLQVSNAKNPSPAKIKTSYTWAPGETIVASCTASTFFSHDPEPPQPTKPGQKGPAVAAAPAR
jgi:type IV pilus assembly protein PilO